MMFQFACQPKNKTLAISRYKYSQAFLSILYTLLLDNTAGSVYKLFTIRKLVSKEAFIARKTYITVYRSESSSFPGGLVY